MSRVNLTESGLRLGEEEEEEAEEKEKRRRRKKKRRGGGGGKEGEEDEEGGRGGKGGGDEVFQTLAILNPCIWVPFLLHVLSLSSMCTVHVAVLHVVFG